MKETVKYSAVSVISAILGGLVVICAPRFIPSFHPRASGEMEGLKQNEKVYDDDFIAQNDPFEKMKKMRKRMENFEGSNRAITNPFDFWFSDKFGGGTINDISKREDDEFVYYDIKVDDVNSTSINTKIERGYVTITGTVEKKSGTEEKDSSYSAHSMFKSSFNRIFPLPGNIDQNKMQMLTEKDKVILKFPKIKV